MCDRNKMVKAMPIQLPVFWCQECVAFFCGQANLDKHNELWHKGDSAEESSEGHCGTCSAKKEGKKNQVEQDSNATASRLANDGLPVWSKQLMETLDGNYGIPTGSKVAEASGPSLQQVLANPSNEKAVPYGSFVFGKERLTQAVLPNNLRIGNKGGTTSSSRTDLPQVTVKVESTVEEYLRGTTDADDEGVVEVEIIYYDCKLCDQEFRRLQDLRAHLEKAHKIDPAPASAVIMELQKSELDMDSDDDGPPLVTYIGGEDLDREVGAVDVNRLLDCVASKRIERIEHKPNTDDSNEVGRKSRSRSPSVEILGFYQPAKADGMNQGSTSKIDSTLCKSRLQKFTNETGSPDVEAMDVVANGINDQGRSSAVRSSNRVQPTSNGFLSCKWCTKSFPKNCHLTDHIRCHQPDQKILQCTECQFKTAESLMGEHISNHHRNKQDQRRMASTSKAFLISQPQALPSRRGISLPHQNAAGGGGVLYSKQDSNHVSKSVAGRASAGGTKKRIPSRSNKKHQCDECPEAFYRPCNLEDHKAMHSGQGPYICPGCGRQDWCRYSMKKHVTRTHRFVGVPATRASLLIHLHRI